MAEALAATPLQAPRVPLIANMSAAKATDPTEIRKLLVDQVTGMVRWRESILAMGAMGVTSFVELGAGKVLSGLVRRILPGRRGDLDRDAGRYRGVTSRQSEGESSSSQKRQEHIKAEEASRV